MSCKSAMYATNTTSQAVAVNGVVSFGNVIRRFGCHTNLSGGNVVLRGTGYYEFDSNFTITGTGNASINFYKDGVLIPGAVATATLVADTPVSISIPFMIRETCDCESTITAVVSGVALTITNASVVVEKL